MQRLYKALQCIAALMFIAASMTATARVPVYFYAVGNWYSGGSDNFQQRAAKLLAHQYPDGYSAFAVEWNQHITPCYNGAGPGYLLESVRPAPSAYYWDDDNYEALYTSLNFYNCGQPSQAHQIYGSGAQRYVTCGGLTLWSHDINGPDSCPRANFDPEKNRGTPPCPCNSVGDPVNPAIGNKYEILPIYTGTGVFPLDLTLTYNSMTGTSGALDRAHQVLGRQRVHSYMRTVRVSSWGSNASAYVLRPDGKTYGFDRNGNDWLGDPDVPDRLIATYDTDGAITGWEYRVGDGDIETFNGAGNLTRVTRNGLVQELSYDASSRLQAVSDPQGRTLVFTYQPDGKISSVSTPDGDVAFSYDASENVARVTWQDGMHRDYLYAEATGGTVQTHTLTGVLDESGTRIDNAKYDSDERTIVDSGPSGTGTTSIDYRNANGVFTSTITHPLGSVEKVEAHFQFGVAAPFRRTVSCVGCTTQTTTYTYDSNGYMATRGEPNGTTTRFTYDPTGLLLNQVRASGTPLQVTTATTWDTTLRKPLKEGVFDAANSPVQTTAFSYDSRGNVTAECLIDATLAPSYVCGPTEAAPPGVRRTTSTYCEDIGDDCPLLGLLKTTDGPRTDVADTISYSYYTETDETGCTVLGGSCHHSGDVRSITDGEGLATTYVAYDKAGRASRIRQPNGILTDYTYTSRGWLATTTLRAAPSGIPSPDDATTTVVYDPNGTIHSIQDADGVTTTYAYDAAHRLTDITDARGARIHYTLDIAGNRTGDQILSASGVVIRSLSRTFNPLAQLIALKDGLNRTVFAADFADSYDATGNLVHSSDGLGIQQKQSFDGLNRLVSTLRDYQGTDPATADAQTATSFDALGRVSDLIDPDGLQTTYDRDALGNVIGLHSPDTGTTTQTFDISGNPSTSVDAANVSRSFTHDASGRLTGTTYPDTTLNAAYRYDETDAITGCAGNLGKGHLTRITESNGSIVYCYDAHGNVVTKRQTAGTVTTTTHYTWTPGDRLASVTTPNGTLIGYVRDGTGRITSVTATPLGGTATTVASNVTYQPFGSIASYTLGNGQTITRTYDGNGQLTDIESTVFSLHFARDAMGNVTAIGDSAGAQPATESYQYDSLYRLVEVNDADGNPVEAYAYNKTGDRLSKTAPGLLTGDYSYKMGTHQLIGVGTTTRQVDARGNTTANVLPTGAFGYGYNQRNRLTVVQKDGDTVASYILNALGQRVQKTVEGVATRFDYDEAGQLLAETTDASTRDYVRLDGLPVGIVDHDGSNSAIKFIYADGLDSARLVTDISGTVVWMWPYRGNPFGENAPASASGYTLNLRFPGQYFDAESGLAYNVNRDYETAAGRYAQSDPDNLSDGPSTYSYVHSSPLQFTDPLGLQAAPAPIPPSSFPGAPGTGRVPGFGPPANEPIFPPGALGAACGRVLGVVGALWPNTTSACDQPYPPKENGCPGGPQCSKATDYQLNQAGISSGHEFKWEYVGPKRASQYDICACRDGSIILKAVGKCGQPGPSIDTHARWR